MFALAVEEKGRRKHMNRRERIYINKMKIRKQQVKRQKFLIGLTIFVFALIVTIKSNVFLSEAQNNEDPAMNYKYYKSIQIQSGDSLWKIAQENMSKEYDSIHDYIDEIKELNHLESDVIQQNSYLTIGYYSHEFK